MKKILTLIAMVAFLAGSSVMAKTKAYAGASAKLNESPSFGGGTVLKPGTELEVIGTEGLFLKVKVDGKTGYVAKMSTTENPSVGKLNVNKTGDSDNSVSARKRSSAYSETASARGLTNSESMRAKGAAGEAIDYTGVEWIEKLSDSIKEEDRNSFNSER